MKQIRRTEKVAGFRCGNEQYLRKYGMSAE